MTSLASSSEDTNPRIPLIQDMRSLETRATEQQLLRYLASERSTQEKRELHSSCLRRLSVVNLVNLMNRAESLGKLFQSLIHLIDILKKKKNFPQKKKQVYN